MFVPRAVQRGVRVSKRDNRMETTSLNILGLSLNMLGVVVIFFFGPPQPILEEGVSIGLEDNTPIDEHGKTVAESNKEIRQKRKIHSLLSKLGLIVIFIGFALQLYAVICAK